MWISPAYAQAAGGGADSGLVSLLPLVLIFVVFYFLLIRPQQKKMKAHKAMVEALRRGDRVVTAGGIIGTVSKVLNDNEVQLEIADGVRVRVVRSTIQDVLSRAEPADKSDKNKAGARKAAEEGKDAASGAKAANDSGGAGAASGGAIGKLSGLLGGRKRDS